MVPSPLAEPEKQYLRSMLMLDPDQWASAGLSQRRVFLRQADPDSRQTEPTKVANSLSGTEPAAVSQELIALLSACVHSFWSEDSERLLHRLKNTSFQNAPELKAVAERLQAWHPVRDQIQELASKMGDKSLGSMLRDMATMSARGIAEFKNHVDYQRRRWFGTSFRSQAQLIKDRYPSVYALDSAWFEQWIGSKR
jgi:hypothetical protein